MQKLEPICGKTCAFPEIPSLDGVERRMPWFTVSRAADKSSRIRTDDGADASGTHERADQ